MDSLTPRDTGRLMPQVCPQPRFASHHISGLNWISWNSLEPSHSSRDAQIWEQKKATSGGHSGLSLALQPKKLLRRAPPHPWPGSQPPCQESVCSKGNRPGPGTQAHVFCWPMFSSGSLQELTVLGRLITYSRFAGVCKGRWSFSSSFLSYLNN